MAHSEIPNWRQGGGHNYNVHVEARGKAHLGDSYYIGVPGSAPLGISTDWRTAIDSPLSSLPYAKDAPFNSFAKQHEPTCLPNTRVDLL